jgi:hypothetical protein
MAGLGHLRRSPSLALPKEFNCTLRRCTRDGIIGVSLFGKRPLFRAAKTKRVCRSVS